MGTGQINSETGVMCTNWPSIKTVERARVPVLQGDSIAFRPEWDTSLVEVTYLPAAALGVRAVFTSCTEVLRLTTTPSALTRNMVGSEITP